MTAVTRAGSSSGSGVSDGGISSSVVGVGSFSTSTLVVGVLCVIGSSLAVVGDGGGEIGAPNPGKLQADKPMRNIDINKRVVLHTIPFILFPPPIASLFYIIVIS
jgi:hypothetical protein